MNQTIDSSRDNSRAHHPQGPSVLESLDPEVGGCAAHVPLDRPIHEETESGSRKHVAVSGGDLSVLEGDPQAQAEVLKSLNFIREQSTFLDGDEFHELRVEVPGINFGTLDYLK